MKIKYINIFTRENLKLHIHVRTLKNVMSIHCYLRALFYLLQSLLANKEVGKSNEQSQCWKEAW